MSERIKRLLAEARELDIALANAVKADYPIGAPIVWKNLSANGGISKGCVIDHGYRDRVKVRNEKTGSEFWIEAPRIA